MTDHQQILLRLDRLERSLLGIVFNSLALCREVVCKFGGNDDDQLAKVIAETQKIRADTESLSAAQNAATPSTAG